MKKNITIDEIRAIMADVELYGVKFFDKVDFLFDYNLKGETVTFVTVDTLKGKRTGLFHTGLITSSILEMNGSYYPVIFIEKSLLRDYSMKKYGRPIKDYELTSSYVIQHELGHIYWMNRNTSKLGSEVLADEYALSNVNEKIRNAYVYKDICTWFDLDRWSIEDAAVFFKAFSGSSEVTIDNDPHKTVFREKVFLPYALKRHKEEHTPVKTW